MKIVFSQRIKKYIKLKLAIPHFEKIYLNLKKEHQNRAILIGSPVHSNLGDHLIAIECLKVIKDLGFDEIVEIPEFLYELFPQQISFSDDDTIFICGGGWMGNLYEDEIVIEEIISRWKDKRIIILPQTIYFSQNGKVSSVENLGKCIRQAENLTLCLRENNSYQFCVNNYPDVKEKFVLLPDMALYSFDDIKSIHSASSKLILFSIREDAESEGKQDFYIHLKQLLTDQGYICRDTSTVIKKKIVKQKDRELIIADKIDEFSKADLVITDRLHSMIFSLLAGTKCCAVDNVTHKIGGVYKSWLVGFPGLLYFETADELKIQKIKNLLSSQENFRKTEFKKLFTCLRK